MKRNKIFAILGCLIVVMAMLAACNVAASFKIMTINIENGDKISLKFSTDQYIWDAEMQKNLYVITEDDSPIFKCAFHTQDTLSEYIDGIIQISDDEEYNIQYLSSGITDGMRYQLISFENDGETVYEAIGWIVGSDTGIVADSYDTEMFMEEILSTLTFEVKSTAQESNDYYYNKIDELK